ncbi:MAG: sigma-70 family RNA polymerase sigma factor [Phycisphaerales bacterium]|nr:sigma-70 family RNA polymerase sigma factor [Phycisphaerales bacterium]
MSDAPDAREEVIAISEADALRHSRGIRRQDPAAITEFYEQWFDWSLATARALTRKDESFCLDVVQDTMLRVIRAIPEIDSAAAMRCWLSRTICNLAIDRIRRDDRRSIRERHAENPSAPPVSSDHLAQAETLAWLNARLVELDAEDAALLRHRFAHDRTVRSIADASGRTEDATHGRIRRILHALRLKGKELDP